MSGLVFPTLLLGEKFTSRKSPKFNTIKQGALSGKASRVALQPYPLYEWELSFELLRDDQQRSNYVPWSNDASQWTGVNSGTGLVPILVQNFALAPDNTLTAARVILNIAATGSGISQVQTSTTGSAAPFSTYTQSVWLKTNDGSSVTVTFTDPVGNQSTLATVTPIWQRFSATLVQPSGSATALVNVALMSAYSTARYADLSVWGAQFEGGGVATTLISTYASAITRVDYKTVLSLFNRMLGQFDTFLYLDPDFNTVFFNNFAIGNSATTVYNLTVTYIDPAVNAFFGPFGLGGMPEIIQNTVGAPKIYLQRYATGDFELLSVGSRTNLCLSSQNLSNLTYWTATGSGVAAPTLTANFSAAPDTSTTATRVQFPSTTGSNSSTLSQAITAVSGSAYTASVWLKTNDGTTATLFLRAGNTTTGPAPYFTLVTIGPIWQRVQCTVQEESTGGLLDFGFSPALGTTTAAVDVSAWGAQFEAGVYPTKYMPTTTASVNNGGSDYSLNATNIVTLGSALLTGSSLYWSGSFYYRCTFTDDTNDFAEILHQWWKLEKLGLSQIIL